MIEFKPERFNPAEVECVRTFLDPYTKDHKIIPCETPEAKQEFKIAIQSICLRDRKDDPYYTYTADLIETLVNFANFLCVDSKNEQIKILISSIEEMIPILLEQGKHDKASCFLSVIRVALPIHPKKEDVIILSPQWSQWVAAISYGLMSDENLCRALNGQKIQRYFDGRGPLALTLGLLLDAKISPEITFNTKVKQETIENVAAQLTQLDERTQLRAFSSEITKEMAVIGFVMAFSHPDCHQQRKWMGKGLLIQAGLYLAKDRNFLFPEYCKFAKQDLDDPSYLKFLLETFGSTLKKKLQNPEWKDDPFVKKHARESITELRKIFTPEEIGDSLPELPAETPKISPAKKSTWRRWLGLD